MENKNTHQSFKNLSKEEEQKLKLIESELDCVLVAYENKLK